MLWYSLEVPHQDASNEYPQHMFSSRNKKIIDIFWLTKSALILDENMLWILIRSTSLLDENICCGYSLEVPQ